MRCQNCPSNLALSYRIISESNAKVNLCQACLKAKGIDIRESQLKTKGRGSEVALQAVEAIQLEVKMPMEKKDVELEQKQEGVRTAQAHAREEMMGNIKRKKIKVRNTGTQEPEVMTLRGQYFERGVQEREKQEREI